ncbi:MAG: hypothetical protein U0136_12770 [Bdellovibrionota bacterium]
MNATDSVLAPAVLVVATVAIAATAGAILYSKRPYFAVSGYELAVRESFLIVCEALYRYFRYADGMRERDSSKDYSYESCLSIWHSTLLGLNELELSERFIAFERIRERILTFLETQNGLGPKEDAGAFFLSLRRLTQDRRYPNSLGIEAVELRAKAIAEAFEQLARASQVISSRPF